MFKGFLKYSIVSAAVCLMSAGCVRENLEEAAGDMRISIGAKVDAVRVATKAAVDQTTALDSDMKINLIRWDEGGSAGTAGREELSAEMGAVPDAGTWYRDIRVSPAQFYVDRTKEVGFAGWYPAKDSSEGAGWVLDERTENGVTDRYVIHEDNTMTFRIDGTTDVMVSNFVKGNYTSGIPAMEFSHALCWYNIYAYAVDADTKAEWGDLTRLTLTNLPEEVVIKLPDDISQSDEIEFSYRGGEETGNEDWAQDGTIIWDTEKHPDTNPAKDLPVGLPAVVKDQAFVGTLLGGAPLQKVLGIEARTTRQTSGNSVSIARNFKPGYIYNIFLRFSSKGIINAEVSASEWHYNENDIVIDQNFDLLTDLSRYGTSNSYIVSSANRGYCFTGNVKGNGEDGNIITDRTGAQIVRLDDSGVNLNVDHIGIVRSDAMMKLVNGQWELIDDENERKNTKILELASDRLSNGRVIFKVPGAVERTASGDTLKTESGEVVYDSDDFSLQYKGNVKIAAFDGAGNIIWSWHIWVTDKPKNQGYSNGYVALDRNLGAVTTDYASFMKDRSAWSGLYYQWGRKDPIFRATVEEGSAWGREVVGHPVSVAEATMHPVTYYYDEQGGNNWTTDPKSDYFWGYVSVRDDIRKTIYDPCPPGYRVPGNPIWENPSKDMTHKSLTGRDGFAGYMFSLGGGMIDIYYPKSYCISDAKVIHGDLLSGTPADEDFVYLYSATPYEPEDGESVDKYGSLSYHFRYNDGELSGNYSQVLVSDPDVYRVKRSDAYPVRCVFENSAPVVTDLSANQTANSYVVAESGFYEFKADVRGNGVSNLNIVSGTTVVNRDFDAGMGTTISGIDHIDVLWWQGDLYKDGQTRSWWLDFIEDNPDSQEIEQNCPVRVLDDGKLADGKVLLYVTVNERTIGNVGLAAYDRNDKILWSWHIWIEPDISLVSLGEYTLMDRNLGATFSPGAGQGFNADNIYSGLGFYYQWGRKDPFFQPAIYRSSTTQNQVWYKKVLENGVWEWKRMDSVEVLNVDNQTVAESWSIEASTSLPTTYFGTDNLNEWQSSYRLSTSAINDLWGYVGDNGVKGNSFAKTMYDPCPPGYRVMQHDVFESAEICAANEDTQYRIDKSNDYGIYFDNSTYVYYSNGARKGYAIAEGIWFPNSGAIRSPGSFVWNQNNQYNHRLSTATPFSGTNMREIRWWPSDNRYVIQENHGSWMSAGRVVRCQME